MRKMAFLSLVALLLSPSVSLAFPLEKGEISRAIWACRDSSRFEEYRTALFNGRTEISRKYMEAGACRRFKPGTMVVIIDSYIRGSGLEAFLVSFRRKGHPYEMWVTEANYALTENGFFRRVTKRSLDEVRKAAKP